MTIAQITGIVTLTVVLSGMLATMFRKLWLTDTIVEIFKTNDTLANWLTNRIITQSLKENETIKDLRNRVAYLEQQNAELKEALRDLVVTDATNVYGLQLQSQLLFQYLRQHYTDLDRSINMVKEGIDIDTKLRAFIKSYLDRKIVNSGIFEKVDRMKIDKSTLS